MKKTWAPLIVLYLLGVIGLIGRYSWSEPSLPFSWRHYFVSAFYFSVFFPTLTGMLGFFYNKQTALIWGSLSAFIFCAPYRWIGLERFAYHKGAEVATFWNAPGLTAPSLNWFPEALLRGADMPYQSLFFAIVIICGAGLIYKFFKTRSSRAVALLVFALIVLQTLLHLSLRSPYTYIAHFEFPLEKNYWSHMYLFPTGRGAVNMDYNMFRYSEMMFMGHDTGLWPMVTRMFPAYLTTQFLFFVNPYYVWIFFNIFIWALLCWVTFSIMRMFIDEKSAAWCSVFMALAQGFIVYVAQPKIYIFSMALPVFLLWLQLNLFQKKTFRPANAFVFGGALALGMLSYEIQPWLLSFLILALWWKQPWRWMLLSFVTAFAVYYGYMFMCRRLPHLYITETFAGGTAHPIYESLNVLKTFDIPLILQRGLRAFTGFFQNLFHTLPFFLLPALAGLWVIKDRKIKIFCLVLALPAAVTCGLMEFAKNDYYTFRTRLAYAAYFSATVLAALALVHFGKKISPRRPWLMPSGFALLSFIYLNLDIFGHPWIYYLWFYRNAGYSFGH